MTARWHLSKWNSSQLICLVLYFLDVNRFWFQVFGVAFSNKENNIGSGQNLEIPQ